MDHENFKFLDKFTTLEDNGIFDTLVTQFGVEQIFFDDENIRLRFEKSEALGQYLDLFALS